MTPTTMKKMRAPFAILAAVLISMPFLAFAQPPGGGPGFGAGDGPGSGARHGGGPGDGIGRFLPPPGYLDLSDEQIEAAQGILEVARAEIEPLREEGRTNREELHALLETENPDPTTVGELMIAGRDLRHEIRDVLEGYVAEFEALLTPEQLEKWENWQELRGKRHHRRGRGGPGFGGPPGGAS